MTNEEINYESIAATRSPHLEEAKQISMGYLMTGLTILIMATLLGYLNRLAQTNTITVASDATTAST